VTFRQLLKISRPRFWIYLFGPYIVGLVCGASTPAALLDWRILGFGIYFLFPANLWVYGTNDIHDWETDKDNPKKQNYEILIHEHQHKKLNKAISIWNIPLLIFVRFFEPIPVECWWVLGGFLLFSNGYSAPPIRAKTKPILDSIFNVLYIFPGVLAYFLAGGQNFHFAVFGAAWLWAMAMHAYSAIPDISVDRAANTPTVATFLGFNGTLIFCFVCYALCALLAFPFLGIVAGVLGAVYLGLMLFSFRAKTEENLMRVYKWFPLINTACGFVLFWAIALSRFF